MRKLRVPKEDLLGLTWDSVDGVRKVVKVEEGKAFVQLEGSRFSVILGVEEIPGEIEFDTKNLKFRRKRQELLRQEEEKEQKKLEEYRDVDGFADNVSPRQRAKVIKTLKKEVSINRVFTTRRDFIKEKVSEGWSVDEKRRLTSPKGSFFTQSDLTKTGIDYAVFLIGK